MCVTLSSGETLVCVHKDQIPPGGGDGIFVMPKQQTLIEGDRDTPSENPISMLQCHLSVLGISNVCVASKWTQQWIKYVISSSQQKLASFLENFNFCPILQIV